MNKISTKNLVLCALFAALTAVFAQIAFDIGPIPINLALLSIFIAGGLLGPKYGTISIFVYVLLGSFGVPVFSHFSGGLGIVVGPTGGYIIGYILAAFLTGIISCKVKGNSYIILPLAMIAGLVVCYIFGTAWYMAVSKADFAKAMKWCVLPFLPGDAIKIALATVIVNKLKKHKVV